MLHWLKKLFEFTPKGRYILILQAVNTNSNSNFKYIYRYLQLRSRIEPGSKAVFSYIDRLISHGYLKNDRSLYLSAGPVEIFDLTDKGYAFLKEHPVS